MSTTINTIEAIPIDFYYLDEEKILDIAPIAPNTPTEDFFETTIMHWMLILLNGVFRRIVLNFRH